MKIAIIGAGPAGLACALECERMGVVPDIYERMGSVGWIRPSVTVWINLFERAYRDICIHLREVYHLDIKPLFPYHSMLVKSPSAAANISGKLGYFVARGKVSESLENQLLIKLRRSQVHFNQIANYKELSQKYDYVVIASGKETASRELGVWQDLGVVYVQEAIALGSFTPGSLTLYWNKEYAGDGYAAVFPFSASEAVVGIYTIGSGPFTVDRSFSRFIQKEKLNQLEIIHQSTLPPFTTGNVKKFQIGNVLLAGRAAGLTDRLMGTGSVAAMISGIMAARSMINGESYDQLIKPIRSHIENISAFRKILEQLDNSGLDKLIMTMDTPVIKQAIYNTGINFTDTLGSLVKIF